MPAKTTQRESVSLHPSNGEKQEAPRAAALSPTGPCPECRALRSIVVELIEQRIKAQAQVQPESPVVSPPLRHRLVDALNEVIKQRLRFVHPVVKAFGTRFAKTVGTGV